MNIREFVYICRHNICIYMIVIFEKDYLQELYTIGQAHDKKHRFQPQIVKKYIRVIDLMKEHEILRENEIIAELVGITELSNHYK